MTSRVRVRKSRVSPSMVSIGNEIVTDSPGREVVSLKTISQILKVNKQKVFGALFMVYIVFRIFIQYL